MNKFQHISVAIVALLATAMTSCDKDGDFLTTNGGGALVLDGTQSDIVLDYDYIDALAMTLYWNDNGKISISDPLVAAPNNSISNTIQFSANEDFMTTVDFLMDAGVYQKQFTVGELNNILGRAGLEGGVKAPVYIRIKGELGKNIAPQYSNVLVVNVTPYVLDMTVGYILTSSMEDTGKTLYSPNSDGKYYGFVGAGAWENWYLQEGDGIIWGNLGVDGFPFYLSSADDKWNFWYPGLSGCYYTVVDTEAAEWSALYIPSLTVSGDLEGEMTYDRKANKWSITFDAPSAGVYTVEIGGTGKQYNVLTATDDAAAVDTPVAFGGNCDALSFGSDASSITIDVASAGETTITIDLNNPRQWTIVAEAGGMAPVETVNEYLYISGIDDGISGSWTFDNYLILYNEDNLNYGGVCNINSNWGYMFYKESEDWSSSIGMLEGGNAYEGSLEVGGSTNIAAPEPGLYTLDVSLSALTYKLTLIESVSYTGLNDDWSVTPMTATETPGVYTANVVKSAETPWGVKILINESWDLFFGGGSGTLRMYQDGFDGDNELANGNYVLTVDLCKGTYSYTAN